jgi:alpha-glucosidase
MPEPIYPEAEVLDFFTKLAGPQLAADVQTSTAEMRARLAAAPKRPPAQWQTWTAVSTISATERGAALTAANARVQLRWISADCLRVWLKTDATPFDEPFSYAVSKTDWPEITPETDPDARTTRTSELTCFADPTSGALKLQTADGVIVCQISGMAWQAGGGMRLSFKLHPQEAAYGLAERPSRLNLRGRKLELWNTDAGDLERDTDPLYYNIPFYLGVHPRGAYGVFIDNTHRMTADIGASDKDTLRFEAGGGDLRCYIFVNPDVKRIVARYTELTGRTPLPPLWSLGYHQSRFSYYPADKVLEIAEQFRKQRIPCDVIHLDIHYMDGFRVFTWDGQHFPAPSDMLKQLHGMGFKVVAILDPAVKIDPEWGVYQSGLENDVFIKYPDGQPARVCVWAGLSYLPDFTNPAARVWWIDEMRPLIKAGIDGIWNDMCEPAIFSTTGEFNTLPDHARHDKDGHGGDHAENHNVYGMMMGRASREALEDHRPGLRPFNIIRAGAAGAQRYASSWTGDNKSDWDHLRQSIPMVLNMGLCGAPMTGPDVGGFREDTAPELLTRWLQLAALMPFFRNHNALFTLPQEPWAHNALYTNANRKAIELRYQLLPYLYACVAQACEYGWPVLRPLFMADAAQVNADDCYLVGDALLVAPVLEAGANTRTLTLPTGEWYDYWTNTRHYGRITVPAPLDRLPLFVRAGAVIPHAPIMQSTAEPAPKTLLMRAYPGTHETTLYEDAGEGLNYQKGDYRWVYVNTLEEENKFTINRRTAGRYQPTYENIRLEIMLQHGDEPADLRVDRRPAPLWFFDAGIIEMTLDTFTTVELTYIPAPTDPTMARRRH